ncbi:hypothetical protein AB4552_01300 [Vibrio sp. 10N.222.54.C3]|uniref:hypothetical protein n=1 Tax=unclassified Vibrio TaxID=2614977 RepID=UPI00354CE2FE
MKKTVFSMLLPIFSMYIGTANATFSIAAQSNESIGTAAATCFNWRPEYPHMMDILSKVVEDKGAVVTIGQVNASDQDNILNKAQRLLNDSTSTPRHIADTIFDGYADKNEKQSLVLKTINSKYGTANFNGSDLTENVDFIISKNGFLLAGNTLTGAPIEGMASNYALSFLTNKSLDYKLITSLFGAKMPPNSGDERCVNTYKVSSTVASVKVVDEGEVRKYQYSSTNNEDALDGLLSKEFRVDFVSYKENAYPYLNLIKTGEKLYFEHGISLEQFKGYRFVLNAHSYSGGEFKGNVYDVTINDNTKLNNLRFNSINTRGGNNVFYILTVSNPDGKVVGGEGAQSDSYYGHLWNVGSNYPNDYPYPK